MTLQMGVLVSAKRYKGLLDGGHEAWRLRALKHERTYGVKSLYAVPDRLVASTGKAPMVAATIDGWREETVEPLPRVYLNMLVQPSGRQSRALRELNGEPGVILINEVNHWKRRMVCEILETNRETEAVVPEIVDRSVSLSQPGVYLAAPSQQALHTTALLWELTDEKMVKYISPREGVAETVTVEDFRTSLAMSPAPERMIHLHLPGWPVGPEGSPAEWRMYACRSDYTGAWTIDASVAKHDAMRIVGFKERSWQLRTGLSLAFGDRAPLLEQRLMTLAFSVVSTITLYIPGIAHCALDFWLDSDGHITLVDVIGRYRTDWLRRTGQVAARTRLTNHPVRLARMLQEIGVEKLHVDFGYSREQDRS